MKKASDDMIKLAKAIETAEDLNLPGIRINVD